MVLRGGDREEMGKRKGARKGAFSESVDGSREWKMQRRENDGERKNEQSKKETAPRTRERNTHTASSIASTNVSQSVLSTTPSRNTSGVPSSSYTTLTLPPLFPLSLSVPFPFPSPFKYDPFKTSLTTPETPTTRLRWSLYLTPSSSTRSDPSRCQCFGCLVYACAFTLAWAFDAVGVGLLLEVEGTGAATAPADELA